VRSPGDKIHDKSPQPQFCPNLDISNSTLYKSSSSGIFSKVAGMLHLGNNPYETLFDLEGRRKAKGEMAHNHGGTVANKVNFLLLGLPREDGDTSKRLTTRNVVAGKTRSA
jgi:hypothetical protein